MCRNERIDPLLTSVDCKVQQETELPESRHIEYLRQRRLLKGNCYITSQLQPDGLVTRVTMMGVRISGRGFLGLSQNGISTHVFSEPSANSSHDKRVAVVRVLTKHGDGSNLPSCIAAFRFSQRPSLERAPSVSLLHHLHTSSLLAPEFNGSHTCRFTGRSVSCCWNLQGGLELVLPCIGSHAGSSGSDCLGVVEER